MMGRLLDWLDVRYGTRQWFSESFVKRRVVAGNPWPLRLGLLAVTFVVLQVGTGVLLLAHYVPTPDGVEVARNFLHDEVELGWFIQGLHLVGASLVVGLSVLYLVVVVLRGTYKTPRELPWFLLVLSVALVFALGYTGSVLPWGERGRQAAAVGTGLISSVPGVGESGASLLRGGEELSGATLRRFLVLHAVVLPALLVCSIRATWVWIRRLRHDDSWE